MTWGALLLCLCVVCAGMMLIAYELARVKIPVKEHEQARFFTHRHYRFEPKEDITAFETATILASVYGVNDGTLAANGIYIPFDESAESVFGVAARHFVHTDDVYLPEYC